MIPRRFRNWVIFWTIIAWVVLELLTYPKTVPITSGFSEVIAGFFSSSVGAYPAWVMLLLAVICIAIGALGLARRSKAKVLNILFIVEGLVFLAWGVLAGGGLGGFSGSANDISYNWALQTVVVVLGGACAWAWAAGNPERAELTTWNTHQVWRLYRGNWQGMVGLGILIVFLAMALLAPFLADHWLLDPNAQIKDPQTGELFGPYHPPTTYYYNWFGTDQVGQSVLAQFIWSARISLMVGLLAAFMSTVLVGAMRHHHRHDHGCSGRSQRHLRHHDHQLRMVLYAMPTFWFGLLMIMLFATKLRWIPTGRMEEPASELDGFAAYQSLA